jgi:hypothetical protein
LVSIDVMYSMGVARPSPLVVKLSPYAAAPMSGSLDRGVVALPT